MPSYQKSKIYKVFSLSNPKLCYYGSTTEHYLSTRFAGHKQKYKKYLNNKAKFYSVFIIFENCKDYIVELVENYPCNNCLELHKREGFYIINYDCINLNIAGRSRKERNKNYYGKNKEKIKDYYKKYNQCKKNERILKYEKNKDKILKINKQYYGKNKNKIKEQREKYYNKNKEKIKDYYKKYNQCKKNERILKYEKNKDKILKINKQYYEKNKNKIKEQREKYYNKNKDKISNYQKEYYKNNKEKISNYKRNYYLKNKKLSGD